MSYDLRDIENVPIIGVAKKLGMKLGFRGENIHAECPFRSESDALHEPLSLVFDRASNTFRCVSCNFRGSALELVCYVSQVGPSQAIEWIGENFYLPGISSATRKATPGPRGETAESASGAASEATLRQAYEDFLLILGGPSMQAIEYMEGRGISVETLKKHGVTDIKGYHGTSNSLKDKYPPELLRRAGLVDATGKLRFEEYPLILPYFHDGEPTFIQAHSMGSGSTPPYLRPRDAVSSLYNVDVLRTLGDGDRVFLVEGIIDCLTLDEHGYHAVATPNLSDFKREWVNDFRGLETYLVHNGDEAPERAARAIAVVFAKADLAVHSIRLPGRHDVNNFFAEGGTQLDFEHLVWTAPKIKTSRPILEGQTRSAMADFLEQLREHQKRTKAIKRPFLGLDTGFGALTRICGGLDPLGSGQMCVVTGPPGVGKTTFCLQMAWQVLENNEIAVLYVSYNEGRFLFKLKTLCQLSKIGATSILRGDVQADRLASAVEEMSKWGKEFFVVEGNKTTTIDVIRDYCQRVKSLTGEPRVLVVVDHLEAVPCPEHDLHGKAKIESCASELHFLSRELAIPIVVVSSADMQQAGRPPHNLDRYGKIEYAEDLALVLSPDPEAAKESPFGSKRLAVRAHVAKNRFGGVGNVLFDFLPDSHYFEEREKVLSSPETESELLPRKLEEAPNVRTPEVASVAS